MRRTLKSVALIMALSYGTLTFAATVESFDSPSNCSYIRLDQGHGPFAKLPVYHQALETERDTDLCYAVTAAQLMDAYRIQNGDQREFLTSPLSIALRTRLADAVRPDKMRKLSYDDSDPLTFLISGGSIAGALRINKNQPVCDQQWLENFTKLIHDSIGAEPVDRFLLGLASQSSHPSGDIGLIQTVAGKLAIKCASHEMKIDFPFPQELKPPGGDFLEAQDELVKKLQDPNLTDQERRKLVENHQKQFDPENKIRLFGETINRLLNQSSGVGIGYLYRAVESRMKRESSGAHASVIVGRQFNTSTQRCEFLVRDSYGPNCQDSNGQDRYLRPCENGSVWVEARILLKDTMNLTWIP
jgi:hypothetical protein